MNTSYLRCDADQCDYIEYMDSIEQSMVNKPCPKCQANLLTQSDYDAWVKFKEILSQLPDAGPEKEVINFHLHNGVLRLIE